VNEVEEIIINKESIQGNKSFKLMIIKQ